jgi:hypothetical protein
MDDLTDQLHIRGTPNDKGTWVRRDLLYVLEWQEPKVPCVEILIPADVLPRMVPGGPQIFSPYDHINWRDPEADWCKDCWNTGTMESVGGREVACLCGYEPYPQPSPIVLPSSLITPSGIRDQSHSELWTIPAIRTNMDALQYELHYTLNVMPKIPSLDFGPQCAWCGDAGSIESIGGRQVRCDMC